MKKILKFAAKNKRLSIKAYNAVKANGVKHTLLKALNYTLIKARAKKQAKNIQAYLDKLQIKIISHTASNKPTMLLTTHDCSHSGAPLLLLNIVKALENSHNMIIITTMGGVLLPDFEQVSYVINLEQSQLNHIENTELVGGIFYTLTQLNIYKAILNTVGGGLFVPYLESYSFTYAILIHEMLDVVSRMNWHTTVLPAIISASHHGAKIVFSSNCTLKQYQSKYDISASSINIISQGVFSHSSSLDKKSNRESLRRTLAIPNDALVIMGAGKDIYRKGLDIFAHIADKFKTLMPQCYFVFCGDTNEAKALLESNQHNKNFIFVNFVKPDEYKMLLNGADAFALTSREDSLPNVILDAASLGLPIIAFDECGGASELLIKINNILIAKKLDIQDFIEKLYQVLNNKVLYNDISKKSTAVIERDYSFSKYVQALLDLLDHKVSVIIPNYNCRKFLKQRLDSVIHQTIAPFEIIFLDDCSSDDSIEYAREILRNSGIRYSIVPNQTNQGTYKQWVKGLELAQGELIWIAEADDYCENTFLQQLVPYFDDTKINLAYCHSELVNEQGESINYDFNHTNDLDTQRWRQSFKASGDNEVENYLIYRNTIPNLSAVVFRKNAVTEYMKKEIVKYKSCGDWLFYVMLLRSSWLAYAHQPLNMFRRHSNSATLQNRDSEAYLDELMQIKWHLIKTYSLSKRAIKRTNEFLIKDFHFNKRIVLQKMSQLLDNNNKSIRLAFITTNPGATEGGGSEILWIETALKLSQRLDMNIAVTIHDHSLLQPQIQLLKSNGVKIYYKDKDNYDVLTKFKPHMAIFSLGDHNEGLDWFNACKTRNVKYCIINQLTKEGHWPNSITGLSVKQFYLSAEKVFFTSTNNLKLMERQIASSIPNAMQHFNPINIDRNTALDFPSSREVYALAFPARYLVLHKGQDVLFETLNQNKWKQRNLIINMYGNGEHQLQLEQLKEYYALDNVIFNTYKKNILDIWRSNHGIIMTSRMEGVPIVLIGAMLCGRVPVVTDVGGCREIIQDNCSGFIAKAPTAELIDEALERAWNARERWEEIGAAAKQSILNFMPEDPVQDFIEKLNIEKQR